MKATVVTKDWFRKVCEIEELEGKDLIKWERIAEYEGLKYSVYRYYGKFVAMWSRRSVDMGFNDSSPEAIDRFKSIVEKEGSCEASWGCTGRTLHQMLAIELSKMFPDYTWEINYEYYLCMASKPGFKVPKTLPTSIEF